jgi:hypothetical protein
MSCVSVLACVGVLIQYLELSVDTHTPTLCQLFKKIVDDQRLLLSHMRRHILLSANHHVQGASCAQALCAPHTLGYEPAICWLASPTNSHGKPMIVEVMLRNVTELENSPRSHTEIALCGSHQAISVERNLPWQHARRHELCALVQITCVAQQFVAFVGLWPGKFVAQQVWEVAGWIQAVCMTPAHPTQHKPMLKPLSVPSELRLTHQREVREPQGFTSMYIGIGERQVCRAHAIISCTLSSNDSKHAWHL